MTFLPSGIFTNGIFTIWHIYQWHFYHLAFSPMPFLPMAILPMAFLPMAYLPPPQAIRNPGRLVQGGSVKMQLGNIVAHVWHDKRDVSVISSNLK